MADVCQLPLPLGRCSRCTDLYAFTLYQKSLPSATVFTCYSTGTWIRDPIGSREAASVVSMSLIFASLSMPGGRPHPAMLYVVLQFPSSAVTLYNSRGTSSSP